MQRMEEKCPQLLDLIPKNREWLLSQDERRSHGGSSEEKKLELRLGPPGQQDWSDPTNNNASRGHKERDDESLLSLGYVYNGNQTNHFGSASSPSGYQHNQTKGPSFLQFSPSSQSLPVTQKASQPCCTKVVDLQSAQKKAAAVSANTAVTNNTSQKRTAPAPVVGWPPIRSFRKNLASSSASKPAPESQNEAPSKVPNAKPVQTSRKGMFVKINMDGVPIGRKIDLSAYASYAKLSSAVDELFRGLLAAQRESCAGGIKNTIEEGKEIAGLLDGSGEYTLVYEDNEGDRMLVGDVPWHMFVSTVKRLRVLKSSELSALSIRSGKELASACRLWISEVCT